MKQKKIIYFILCILMMSCSQSNKQSVKTFQISNNIPIETDDYLLGKNRFYLSKLFRKVKTIILETKEDVLIGMIKSMQVYKDSIFILDFPRSNGVYLFNKEGRFLKKYGNIGQGPGEYLKAFDFTLDFKNKILYILDSNSQSILMYNLKSGKYIKKIHLMNSGFKSFHIQYTNNRLFTDAHFYEKNASSFLLQEINTSTGTRIRDFLPAKLYNKNFFSKDVTLGENVFYDRTQEYPKFIQYFMDTVISICPKKIMPLLYLKSNKLLKEEDIQDLDLKKESISMRLSAKDIIYHISDFCSYKDVLYFTFKYMDRHECCLYNKKTEETQIINSISDDLIYKVNEGGSYLIPEFCTSNEAGMYAYINPLEMNMFLELIKNNSVRSDLDKLDKLKQLTPESNPVIFVYE